MKKIIAMVIILILGASLIGCGGNDKKEETNQKTSSAKNEKENIKFKCTEQGFIFDVPPKWNEAIQKGENIFVLMTEVDTKKEEENSVASDIKKNYPNSSEVEYMFFEDKVANNTKLLELFSINRKDWDEAAKKGIKIENVIDSKKYNFKLKEKNDANDLVYLVVVPNIDNMKVNEKYKEFYNTCDEIMDRIECVEVVTPKQKEERYKKSLEGKISFKSEDLDGNEVTDKIFSDSKLTMVNIWGTECGPCIEEMPELQKLYSEMKDKKVNIIGIVKDGAENGELAKSILSKKGVKFKNIIANDEVNEKMLKKITATPTTIFIDYNGKLVGDPAVGARKYEDYKKLIEKYLK